MQIGQACQQTAAPLQDIVYLYNLISRKSKKHDVVVRYSAEAKYRAMALVPCELI